MVDTFDFHATFVGSGEGYNTYSLIDEETADRLYGVLKDFWSSRTEQSPEEIRIISDQYRHSNFHESWKPVREKIFSIQSETASHFSMVDLGGANGSIYYVLNDALPDAHVPYVLIEPFAPFVDDFKSHFPDQTAICADAEAFVEMDADIFADRPYAVFFASLVLCMLKPSIARNVIQRAAQIADHIVLADNIMNVEGQLSVTDTIIFDYFPEGFQFYFSHPFKVFFEENGFELVDVTPTLPRIEKMKMGFGVVHGRRIKPR